MNIHADFSQRVLLQGATLPWADSPVAGVQRRLLDRVGGEVARATSIVRYAPGSTFTAHTHGGGEEFLVLEGVFQDERGDYPAGCYVRNPPTSRHTPGSASGCVIFVKLWQFDPADRTHVVIHAGQHPHVPAAGRPGVSVLPLFEDGRETVRLERWGPAAPVRVQAPHGAELLVLQGQATESGALLQQHAWLRIPRGGRLDAVAGPQGTQVWLKLGGLRDVRAPDAAGG